MPLTRRTDNGPWIADFYDSNGIRQRVSTKTKNKTAAQKIYDQLKLDAVANRFGVQFTSKSNLLELVDEYIAYLGQTADIHQTNTAHRIKRIINTAGWTNPRQITQYKVETIVRELKNERPSKADQNLSLQTQSHYLAAIKAFTVWLVDVRKSLPVDPLSAVKKPSAQTDRRLVRRFLTQAEWEWLSRTENAPLYATAIQTGYRASELLALTPASLKRDYLELPAKFTKNKKTARQHITLELAEMLRGKLPFQVQADGKLAALLRNDLASARWMAMEIGPLPRGFLEPKDAEGRVLDFHSLRHTCGSWLAMAGVSPKVIQSVMRHSTITLTLDRYGHLFPGAERDAAAVLGSALFVSKT